MPGLNVGSVSIAVVPSVANFTDSLRSKLLPESDALGEELGRHIADGINAALHDISVTVTAHADTAEASAALDELARKTVTPTVSLDDTRIVAALEAITLQLSELDDSVTNVRLTLEDSDIGVKLDDIGVKLDDIGTKDVKPKVTLDDSDFNAKIDEDKAKLDALGNSSASPGVGGGGFPGGLMGAGILGGLAASPALPGALSGAATSVGVLGLAYSQISPALQAYSANTTAAATASAKMGTASSTTAHAVSQAQAALTAAQTQQAHDAITSAQTQVMAEQQLQSAEYSEQQAQVSLTLARQQAVLTLQSLNNASADAVLNAQQARLSLEQAQLTQTQTNASSTATALQKQQADLNVALAEQHLKESLEARTNSAKAAATADKAGVDGSPAVLAAQHNLVTAHQAVANAQTNVANASRNAAWQQQADALRVAQAQAAVTYAAKGTTGGFNSAAQAAAAYAAQMSNLNSAGQQMVKILGPLLYGPTGLLSKLQGAASTAILPGFKTFISGFKDLAPMITTEIGKMGGILSQGMASMGKTMASSGFQKDLKALFDEGNQFMKILGPAIGGVAKAFLDMGAKSGPAVTGLAKGLSAILGGVGDLFKNLAPYAKGIGGFFEDLGKIIGSLGGPLGQVLGILASALKPLLDGVLPLLKSALASIAPVLQPLVSAALPLLETALTALQPLFSSMTSTVEKLAPQLAGAVKPLIEFADTLIKDLAPFLPQIVTLFGKLASDAFAALGRELVALLPSLETLATSVFGSLKTLLPVVVTAFEKIGDALLNQLAKSLPQLVPALTQMAISFSNMLIAITPLLPPLIEFGTKLIDVGIKGLIPLINHITNFANGIAEVVTAITGAISWVAKIDDKMMNWGGDIATVQGWFSDFGKFLSSLWSQIFDGVKTAWNAISSFIAGSWNTTYKSISSILGTIMTFLSGSWTKITIDVKNAWNAIVSWVTGTLAGGFKSAFQAVVNGISSVWNTLQSIVSKPVDFIVNTIYDKGILGVVNAVGGLIGLHLNPVKMAAGGKVTAGTGPESDDVLARVSKGETVVSAAHSQALAPVFAAVGVPGYARGGIPGGGVLNDIVNGAGSVVSAIGKSLANLSGDALAAAAGKVLQPLVAAMPGGGTALGSDLKKIPQTVVADLISKLKGTGGAVTEGGGGGAGGSYTGHYGSGVQQWSTLVQKVLKELSLPAGDLALVLNQMQSESGGNPNIVNEWDSNWKAGHPSVGLMQVIQGTFDEWAGPFKSTGPFKYGVSVNPEANIYAGLNYAKHGAGFGTGAGQVGSMHGYDEGGWLPPGLTLTANGTGRPEPILTGAQWDMISAATTGGDDTGTRNAKQHRELIATLRSIPGQTGGHVGEALNGTARSARSAAYYRTR